MVGEGEAVAEAAVAGAAVLHAVSSSLSSSSPPPSSVVDDQITELHGLAAIAMSTFGKGTLVAIGPHPESTHRNAKFSKAVGERSYRRLVQRAVLVAAGTLK